MSKSGTVDAAETAAVDVAGLTRLDEREVPGGIQWDALDSALRNRLETPGEIR